MAPVPGIYTLSASGDYQLTQAGNGAGPDGWLLTFISASWTGSLVLKSNTAAPGFAPSLTNVGYYNANTGAPVTAGTAITSTTVSYFVRDTAYDLYTTYTHTAGQVTIVVTPANNAAGGGGPGGTVSARDVTSGVFGANTGDTGTYTFPADLVVTTTVTAARHIATTGTITTSQPAFSGTQTWNAGGVTFTGILLNVTDTASAAASLLADLQVAGVSQFSVTKAGAVTAVGTYTSAAGKIALGATPGTAGAINVDAASYSSIVLAFQSGATVMGQIGIVGTGNVYLAADSGKSLTLRANAISKWMVLSEASGTASLQSNENTARIIGGATASALRDSGNARNKILWHPTIQIGDGTTTTDGPLIIDFGAVGAATASVRLNGLTNGAGASAGTITNAPSIGNPNFWIPISIAGTVRYVPAW